MPSQGSLKEPGSHVVGNGVDRVVQALDDGLSFESFHCKRRGLCGHDDEGHNRHWRVGLLHAGIEAAEGLDEHVNTLVSILVSTGSEEVEGVCGIKVIVAV